MIVGGTLVPAYGRDYTKRADIIADLNAGQDFRMETFNFSGYCSIRDLADGQFQARDKSRRKLWTINIENGVAK